MDTVTIRKDEYKRLKKIENIDKELLEDIAHGIKDIILDSSENTRLQSCDERDESGMTCSKKPTTLVVGHKVDFIK